MTTTQTDQIGDQNYNILVVDDNQINQIITRKILEKASFSCSMVDDGYQAIDLLEEQSFDIILMDLNMPLISGFETTKLIREKGIVTPIIALTAFAKEEVVNEVISSGMTDIMTKPYDSELLYDIIKRNVIK